MSSITFHSIDGNGQPTEVQIGGAERAYAAWVVNALARGVTDTQFNNELHDRLRRMLLEVNYLATANRRNFDDALLGYLARGGRLRWGRSFIDGFALVLNTAIVLGSEPVRFLTRLHGTCEIHGWVDAPNAAWLAGVVDRGLASSVIRAVLPSHYGTWQDVTAFLRAASAPVVMSYSVTDSFPNPMTAGVGSWDDFATLGWTNAWNRSIRALREQGDLEIRPDDWEEFRFGHQLSILDLIADDYEDRLDIVFPREHPAHVTR